MGSTNPQTFEYNLIIDAYEQAYKNNYYGTDDSMLVENIGQSVTMVMGSYENIKITSPEDLNIAEQILNMEKEMKLTVEGELYENRIRI